MNAIVGQPLDPSYQWVGVILSYVVAVLGSFTALQCARHMFRRDGTVDRQMAIGAGVSLGGIGIWSMHFIGMLAWRPGVTVNYDALLTVVSLVAAVVISAVALYLAGRRGFGRGGWLAGSVLAGLGVCVMHYMGMFAMNMRATMSWDLGVVAASVAIAVFAAAAALWLAFNLKRESHRVLAAFVMGVAVCAMHYTGMESVSLVCISQAPENPWLIGGRDLDMMVFALATGVLLYIFWMLSGRSERQRVRARPAGRRGTSDDTGPAPL